MIFSIFLECSNSFIFSYKHFQGQRCLLVVKILCLPYVLQCLHYSLSFYNFLFQDKICAVTNEKVHLFHLLITLSLCYEKPVCRRHPCGSSSLAETAFCRSVIHTLGSSVIHKPPWFIHALRGQAWPFSHPDRGECCHDSC